jgi:hypothetical protein
MLERIGVLVVLLAALGCGGRGTGGGAGDGGVTDGASVCPAGSVAVPLDGGFTCYEANCSTGQLCIPWPASRDGSVFTHECVDVPANCPVCQCNVGADCTAACVVALCGGAREAAVRGRTLDCPYLQ